MQLTIDDLISFSATVSQNEGQGKTLTKEEGQARAEANANPVWKAAALSTIHIICEEQETFTADDILERLESAGMKTHDNRALGGILRTAGKMGLCRLTDRFQPSRLKVRHRRPVGIWRSLMI